MIIPSRLFWLVEADPWIEWHGDAQYVERWGPDHPLCQPMDPTPYALVMATGREPLRPDLGILDVGVPMGPVLPSPLATRVNEASTISGLWMKVTMKAPT